MCVIGTDIDAINKKTNAMNRIICIAFFIFAFAGLQAQDNSKLSRKEKKSLREEQKIKEVKTMLNNKHYEFVPTQVLPISMQPRNLSGTFRAEIKNDSIYSYLPFYGRAYSAVYNSTEGPFTFELPINDYKKEKDKKGYLIEFEVKNKSDLLKFMFKISPNGYTTLHINSTNRQAITYYGRLEKPKE